MVLITFDKRGYINFLVPVLLTHSFYLECYYSRCWEFLALVLILEPSKWQPWAWESFRAHYHSLLNLLAGSRLNGQTLLQPSRQIEAMIRGLTDAAQSLGSHPLYSHCWDSRLSRVSTITIHNAHTQFAVETRKWAAKRNVSSYRLYPNALVLNSYKSVKQFVKFIIWGQRSGGACKPTPFFSLQKMNVYRKLWKTVYCAVDSLRGSYFPIHGNEEFAISWALPGGSAQQQGEGRRRRETQCCKLHRTIYAIHAWASIEETWCLLGNWFVL